MKFVETMTGLFETAKDTITEHGPEILVVAGVVGVVGTVIGACVATTKLDDELEESKKALNDIREAEKAGEINGREYTKKEVNKDKIRTYSRAAFKVVKLYSFPVVVGVLSITAILSSNHILQKRNVELAGAYTAISSAYQTYQNRVIEKYGEDAHKEILFGTKKQKATIEEVDEETGEIKKKKDTVDVIDSDGSASPYLIEFSTRTSAECRGNEDYDMMFIKARTAMLNNTLHLGKGSKVNMNDIADAVGVTRDQNPIWPVAGYRNDRNNGDGYIDLRPHYVYRNTEDGGLEKVMMLDPNVEGLVYDIPGLK